MYCTMTLKTLFHQFNITLRYIPTRSTFRLRIQIRLVSNYSGLHHQEEDIHLPFSFAHIWIVQLHGSLHGYH